MAASRMKHLLEKLSHHHYHAHPHHHKTTSEVELLSPDALPPTTAYNCRIIELNCSPHSHGLMAKLELSPEGIQLSYEGFSHFFHTYDIQNMVLEPADAGGHFTMTFHWNLHNKLITSLFEGVDGQRIWDHFNQIVHHAVHQKGLDLPDAPAAPNAL